jgi:hypothetical protein
MLDGTVMVSEVDFEVIGKRMAAPRVPSGLRMASRPRLLEKLAHGKHSISPSLNGRSRSPTHMSRAS